MVARFHEVLAGNNPWYLLVSAILGEEQDS